MIGAVTVTLAETALIAVLFRSLAEQRRTRRALQVIRGIRDLVKKGPTPRSPVGLNRLVLEVVRLTHSNALSGCCAVLTELEPGLPLVHVDPVQLQQVLLNLVLNAFEALQEVPAPGRRLVLATKADAGRSLVHAIVRDFGPGLFASAVEGTGLKRWRRQKF